MSTAVPPPPRKTLLEWITDDDGEQPEHARPACSPAVSALHARLCIGPDRDASRDEGPREPLAPPASFALTPLG